MAEENAAQQELQNTLKKAVQQSLHQSMLAKGLHETCKAVEAQTVKLVVLGDDCDNKDIVALVKALCQEYKVPILPIASGQTLGEWLGLIKKDAKNNIIKRRKVSVLAIKDFPEDITEEEVKHIMDSI